jgi:hypothetical protein
MTKFENFWKNLDTIKVNAEKLGQILKKYKAHKTFMVSPYRECTDCNYLQT